MTTIIMKQHGRQSEQNSTISPAVNLTTGEDAMGPEERAKVLCSKMVKVLHRMKQETDNLSNLTSRSAEMFLIVAAQTGRDLNQTEIGLALKVYSAKKGDAIPTPQMVGKYLSEDWSHHIRVDKVGKEKYCSLLPRGERFRTEIAEILNL